MNGEYPDFDAAVERLQTFLSQEGWPNRIVWLHARGVTTHGRRIVLHRRRFLDRFQVAALYQQAATRSLGVLLAGLTHDNSNSYCYLWAPSDPLESEYAMMPNGLKLSLRTDPDPVSLVGTVGFLWRRLWGPPPEVTNQLLA